MPTLTTLPMSQRLLRVRELIRRELGALLQKEMDFDGLLVSIHDVDITPDLRHCHVFFGVIGRNRDEHWVLEQLEKHRGVLQSKLSKRVILKHTPQLHFKADHSIERGVRTLQALEAVDLLPTADLLEEEEEPQAAFLPLAPAPVPVTSGDDEDDDEEWDDEEWDDEDDDDEEDEEFDEDLDDDDEDDDDWVDEEEDDEADDLEEEDADEEDEDDHDDDEDEVEDDLEDEDEDDDDDDLEDDDDEDDGGGRRGR